MHKSYNIPILYYVPSEGKKKMWWNGISNFPRLSIDTNMLLGNMEQRPRMPMEETKTGVEGCPIMVLNLGNKRKNEHLSMSSTLASNYGSFESKFRAFLRFVTVSSLPPSRHRGSASN
jgi:hypothetical protein